ncbi:MAG: PIN domain-containing protein [Thiobacillaceae bacterium]
MPAERFLDTNILLYLYSEDEPDKRTRAQLLVRGETRAWVSTQVLSEMANVLHRKFGVTYPDIAIALHEIRAVCATHQVTAETITLALSLAERYRHSYYDSLILAAALECGCNELVSEDMQNGFVIDSRLTIRNPFV